VRWVGRYLEVGTLLSVPTYLRVKDPVHHLIAITQNKCSLTTKYFRPHRALPSTPPPGVGNQSDMEGDRGIAGGGICTRTYGCMYLVTLVVSVPYVGASDNANTDRCFRVVTMDFYNGVGLDTGSEGTKDPCFSHMIHVSLQMRHMFCM